jgi:hypothetical protein
MITKTMSICSNVGHFAGYQTGKKQVKLFQKLIYFPSVTRYLHFLPTEEA